MQFSRLWTQGSHERADLRGGLRAGGPVRMLGCGGSWSLAGQREHDDKDGGKGLRRPRARSPGARKELSPNGGPAGWEWTQGNNPRGSQSPSWQTGWFLPIGLLGRVGTERLQVAVAPPGRWTHLSGESGLAWASELPFRAHSHQSGWRRRSRLFTAVRELVCTSCPCPPGALGLEAGPAAAGTVPSGLGF